MPVSLLHPLLPALPALLLAGPVLAQQQPPAPAIPADSIIRPAHVSQPLWILDSRVVLGHSVETIDPHDIASLEVFKGDVLPRWRSIAGDGILVLRLKNDREVPSRSLPDLRRQLGVRGPVRYELDGQPLQDEHLRIATQAIDQLSVRPPAPGETASTVAIRLKPYVPQPKNDPPGTIYIRGARGR